MPEPSPSDDDFDDELGADLSSQPVCSPHDRAIRFAAEPLTDRHRTRIDPGSVAPLSPARATGGGNASSDLRQTPRILGSAELSRVLTWIDANSLDKESGRAVVLATHYTGARPSEIVDLRARTLFDATGRLRDTITIPSRKTGPAGVSEKLCSRCSTCSRTPIALPIGAIGKRRSTIAVSPASPGR